MNKWQSIDTAPKDGTRIVVIGPILQDASGVYSERQYACVTQYHTKRESPSWAIGWEFTAPGLCTVIKPTHWIPLP